ncbi:hypothetical protein QW71_26475 [Paenibacillus sp. IHB B 3415]|uniref:hypothetical protein n=1 Tax=Paenibacillus sp. IHB B 3415 TaxID=867080 RepID=UPI000574F012|nr:hypothetical protein [Paenibacillus sp. IHB B 3415]KHL92937.1 hypothetical protein QW71_26475 [Paenibacillus sp. IHB B 3415]
MKSVHLVCSPELIMLLSRSLEHEGYVISGKHSTLHSFIRGFSSKEVDPSSIVIMEGGAGLGTPVKAAEIVGFMTLIRKYLKHTRLIVQLDPALKTDIEFIRTMVNMNIHDLQFTTEFRGDDLLNWIREKKTTRDYYTILGKKKGLFSFKGTTTAPASVQPSEEPAQAPARPAESLTRPQPAARSGGASAGVRPSPATGSGGGSTSPRPRPVVRTESSAADEGTLESLEQSIPVEGQQAVPAASARILGSNVPLVIGICGAGGEEDVGAAAFLLAAGLADLGWKPLVCGDNRPEISSLEQIVFEGEQADSVSTMFEYEGVTFYRRGYSWDISELLASEFTHIILWVDIHQERKGTSALELWWNSQIPILVGNGAMWKYELLKEKLNTLNPFERKRCRLLLENGHQEVLQMLKKDFPEMQATLMPAHQDPLYPDKEAVEWVMKLLTVQKKLFRKQTLLWGIAGAVLFVTLILIGLGMSFVPQSR